MVSVCSTWLCRYISAYFFLDSYLSNCWDNEWPGLITSLDDPLSWAGHGPGIRGPGRGPRRHHLYLDRWFGGAISFLWKGVGQCGSNTGLCVMHAQRPSRRYGALKFTACYEFAPCLSRYAIQSGVELCGVVSPRLLQFHWVVQSLCPSRGHLKEVLILHNRLPLSG